MKRMSTKLFLYSLTSLAVTASSVAYAQQDAQAPALEGGFSAYIGTFYAVPSANDLGYFVDVDSTVTPGFPFPEITASSTTLNSNADYDWGWQAGIGYVFDGTANSVELNYRGYSDSNTSSNTTSLFGFSPDSVNASGKQKNKYQNWDLMITQFLDIGTHFQMRVLGGLSYLADLKQSNDDNFTFNPGTFNVSADGNIHSSSKYSGWGPRIGADGRYDFGQGFGIVGGASVAYFLGDLNTSNSLDGNVTFRETSRDLITTDATNNPDNHAVSNLRGNLGIDYVYFFEDEMRSTLGLELGYQVDSYFDGVARLEETGALNYSDITFSGPYLNLKGVF